MIQEKVGNKKKFLYYTLLYSSGKKTSGERLYIYIYIYIIKITFNENRKYSV